MSSKSKNIDVSDEKSLQNVLKLYIDYFKCINYH